MHIGVDLDNTVLDATETHLKYYNLASGLSFTPDDVDDFYIYRLYGWEKAERDSMYQKYGLDIHWDSVPFPMAVDSLNELFEQHKISIITSRPLFVRDVTVEWLHHHKVNYHNIVFTENKLQACMESNVDVLIDDAPHYAEEFSLTGKPVILYEQPYNVSVAGDFVFRASNWLEVKYHIEHLKSRFG